MIQGHATEDGTSAFKGRFQDTLAKDHYTLSNGKYISSIGLGSYLGDPTNTDDEAYQNSAEHILKNGCNVIDTAINYRFQRSERNIGLALESQLRNNDNHLERDQIIISTKGGFIPFDGDQPDNPRDYIRETYVDPGIIEPRDLVAGSHCMTPKFLKHELNKSRDNLKLETIDIYFIHNPETQFEVLETEEFYSQLKKCFECLETAVERNEIRSYGLATWNGFRVAPDNSEFLDLERVLQCARDAKGDNHHFDTIQLPYNLAMPEALTARNQTHNGENVSTLRACAELDLTVMSSASLMQGRFAKSLPDDFRNDLDEFHSDAQRALQFTRSAPGVTTSLVGMKDSDHIEENLGVTEKKRINEQDYVDRFFVREET